LAKRRTPLSVRDTAAGPHRLLSMAARKPAYDVLRRGSITHAASIVLILKAARLLNA
jgi:hypothetical protein